MQYNNKAGYVKAGYARRLVNHASSWRLKVKVAKISARDEGRTTRERAKFIISIASVEQGKQGYCIDSLQTLSDYHCLPKYNCYYIVLIF